MTSSITSSTQLYQFRAVGGDGGGGKRARPHSSKSAPFAVRNAPQRHFIDFTSGSRVADGVRMMVRFRRLMKAARAGVPTPVHDVAHQNHSSR